jgi:disease resistance protein RPM1
MLRHLNFIGRLEKLPEWIPKLQNLVKLKLNFSRLNHDIIELLKSMSNLLTLSLKNSAYVGERLHFQDGWFKNLKELILEELYKVNCILIDEGALPSLEYLILWHIPKVKTLPTGIQHLKKLKHLHSNIQH